MKISKSVTLSKKIGLTEISPDMNFKDQTVLVTGAADGIGASEVRNLHQMGAYIIALDVQAKKLEALKIELGEDCMTTIAFDLSQTDEKTYEKLGKDIISAAPNGKIDAYIMNAGVVKLSDGKGISGISSHELRTLTQINAFSHADIFRVIASNLADDARIVVTSSPIVGRSDLNTPGYAISKGALEAVANNIAGEFKGTHKKISGYVPPPVQNFLRTDLKPDEPYYAHPCGEDISELPLRLASKNLREEFNCKVVAMGYDHLRHKDGKTPTGQTFDYMPRDPGTNGFIYDLRIRDFASSGGDSGEDLQHWDTSSSREIQGLGRTPDMVIGKALNKIYDTPTHISKHRTPEL